MLLLFRFFLNREELGALNLNEATKNLELVQVQARVEDITLREEQPKSKVC